MLDMDEVNTAVCQELTLLKLELLRDFDINYRPGYRVVLEENLQRARDFGLKEYKIQLKEVEGQELDNALDYLHKKEAEYQNEADKAKAKQTEDHDYPIREYWGFVAAHKAMQILMKQLTDSDTTKL